MYVYVHIHIHVYMYIYLYDFVKNYTQPRQPVKNSARTLWKSFLDAKGNAGASMKTLQPKSFVLTLRRLEWLTQSVRTFHGETVVAGK